MKHKLKDLTFRYEILEGQFKQLQQTHSEETQAMNKRMTEVKGNAAEALKAYENKIHGLRCELESKVD